MTTATQNVTITDAIHALHAAFGDVAEIWLNGGGYAETFLRIDPDEGTVILAENAESMDLVEWGAVPTVAEVRRWMKQGYTD
jgi:hypothetical protein